MFRVCPTCLDIWGERSPERDLLRTMLLPHGQLSIRPNEVLAAVGCGSILLCTRA